MDARAIEGLSAETLCPIVELRQYRLHPGGREVLIELFDRALVETQEDVGMTVIGQFRDLDRPDRFVWLRGFPDMPARARSLEAFYGGPVWAAHRDAANATMIDHTDVLLLKPARADLGFRLVPGDRPPAGAAGVAARSAGGAVMAVVYPIAPAAEPGFLDFFEAEIGPGAAGAATAGCFVTERSPNTYPRLPVREGETVFVWFARVADPAAFETELPSPDGLAQHLVAPPVVLRLAPTARSWLR